MNICVLKASLPAEQSYIIKNLLSHLRQGGHIRTTPELDKEIVNNILKELVENKEIEVFEAFNITVIKKL